MWDLEETTVAGDHHRGRGRWRSGNRTQVVCGGGGRDQKQREEWREEK